MIELMSRDIFVQDIPAAVHQVDDIPDDWRPSPLPFSHRQVVEAVIALAPAADVSDPEWIQVEMPGIDIEVNVADVTPLDSFALHVRGSDRAACNRFVASLLDVVGARAFDTESDSGIFVWAE